MLRFWLMVETRSAVAASSIRRRSAAWTAAADSLKVLDPKRPIREADIAGRPVARSGRSPHWLKKAAKPPGLGCYRRLCLRPHTVAVIPVRHPLGVELTGLPKPARWRVPSPTSESYLTNSADCDPQSDNAAKFRILHKNSAVRCVLWPTSPSQ